MDLFQKRPLAFGVTVLLLVSLPVLAWLQYQWLGQLSANERVRMQSNLRVSADRFAEEFDTELARLSLAFSGGIVSLEAPADGEADLIQRLGMWSETAPRPELIESFFRIEREPAGHRIRRFNKVHGEFIDVDWSGLENVRRTLDQQAPSGSRIRRLPTDQRVLDDPPTLILPQMSTARAEFLIRTDGDHEMHLSELVTDVQLDGWVVIALDEAYLRDAFLPELVERHFSDTSGGDYRVAVAHTDSDLVFYESEEGQSADVLSHPDAMVPMFDLGRDVNFWTFDATRISERIGFGTAGAVAGLVGGRSPTSDVIAATAIVSEQETGRGPRIAMRTFETSAAAGSWHLLVQHRAGSLEAAVDQVRSRNLMISFGILMMLGVSMVIIMVSSQRAQRLAQQQVDFVANISHELRTPVAVINSAGQNLEDGLIDSERARKYGSVIRNEAKRLSAMVEQVMDFAGDASGKKRYQIRPVSVEEVLDGALSDYRPLMAEKGFALETDIAKGLPEIAADPSAVRSAIGNLLSNAMKYCGSHPWARLAVEGGLGWVEIRVQDRGIGIPQAEVDRVFEPFYRGREAVDSQIHGNGLGLSLVRRVVDAHGGEVRIESKPGDGSVFILRFPVAEGSHA